jgi:hypothetical protein
MLLLLLLLLLLRRLNALIDDSQQSSFATPTHSFSIPTTHSLENRMLTNSLPNRLTSIATDAQRSRCTTTTDPCRLCIVHWHWWCCIGLFFSWRTSHCASILQTRHSHWLARIRRLADDLDSRLLKALPAFSLSPLCWRNIDDERDALRRELINVWTVLATSSIATKFSMECAGYCAALLVALEFFPGDVELLATVAQRSRQAIVAASIATDDGSLMYTWHGKRYLGYAHGLAGICNVLYLAGCADAALDRTVDVLAALAVRRTGRMPSSNVARRRSLRAVVSRRARLRRALSQHGAQRRAAACARRRLASRSVAQGRRSVSRRLWPRIAVSGTLSRHAGSTLVVARLPLCARCASRCPSCNNAQRVVTIPTRCLMVLAHVFSFSSSCAPHLAARRRRCRAHFCAYSDSNRASTSSISSKINASSIEIRSSCCASKRAFSMQKLVHILLDSHSNRNFNLIEMNL